MVREVAGVLFDVLDDVLEAVDGVAQQQQPFLRQAVAVVVELADVVLHRLRHLDALADTGRLGDAAQRVGGAVQCFRHRIRSHGLPASRDEVADDGDVTRGLLAEDVVQHRIEARLAR